MAEGNSTTPSTVLSDVEITGTIKFNGDLIFDGKLTKGSIEGNALFAGNNSDIKGEIRTNVLTLFGKIAGKVTVNRKCELRASAQINGDLKAAQLVMADGATLIGQVQIGNDSETAQHPAGSD